MHSDGGIELTTQLESKSDEIVSAENLIHPELAANDSIRDDENDVRTAVVSTVPSESGVNDKSENDVASVLAETTSATNSTSNMVRLRCSVVVFAYVLNAYRSHFIYVYCAKQSHSLLLSLQIAIYAPRIGVAKPTAATHLAR